MPLHAFTLGGHPLLVSVGHDLCQVVRVKRVEDVEEVIARRAFAHGILVREVLHELGVLQEHWIDSLDTELWILRHLDVNDLLLLHELLLSSQDLLDEVLVHDSLVWEVELDYKGVRSAEKRYLRC